MDYLVPYKSPALRSLQYKTLYDSPGRVARKACDVQYFDHLGSFRRMSYMAPYKSSVPYVDSKAIHRTSNASPAPIQHMSINHCGFDVFVAEQFLDGSDVIAVLKQVGGERMPQGMAACWPLACEG